jgi:hypothetical protein
MTPGIVAPIGPPPMVPRSPHPSDIVMREEQKQQGPVRAHGSPVEVFARPTAFDAGEAPAIFATSGSVIFFDV